MFEVLEQLEKTSGTNDKLAILWKNKDNNELMQYFKLALDLSITFGIKKLPDYELMEGSCPWVTFVGLCNDLSARVLTGNNASFTISNILEHATPLQNKWYRKCLQKDLASMGIGRSLVERIWPNLCGKFKCNLAEEEEEIVKFDWRKGASIELKLNGVRTLVCILAGKIAWIKGRSGLEIEKFYPIIFKLEEAFTVEDSFVLDGEVHCENSLEDTMTVFGTDVDKTRADFKTDKAYQKWVDEKQSIALALRAKCTYDVFDILPIEEFESQTCTKSYLERRVELLALQKKFDAVGLKVGRVVDSQPVKDKAEAVTIANQFMAQGLEGGILKANGAPYQYKRARNFIKIKECTGEFEAQIVGYTIAKEIYDNEGNLDAPQLGAFKIRYRNPANTFSESEVGTGKFLTKAKKEEIARNPESWINKIVTISAQRFSEDNILICPRIERDRPDRTSLEE